MTDQLRWVWRQLRNATEAAGMDGVPIGKKWDALLSVSHTAGLVLTVHTLEYLNVLTDAWRLQEGRRIKRERDAAARK